MAEKTIENGGGYGNTGNGPDSPTQRAAQRDADYAATDDTSPRPNVLNTQSQIAYDEEE